MNSLQLSTSDLFQMRKYLRNHYLSFYNIENLKNCKRILDFYNRNRGYFAYSRDFAIENNIDWIYTDWILPYNDDIENQQIYIEYHWASENENILTYYYNLLLDLNPQLKIINAPTLNKKNDVIMGAISKFILDDIKEFVEIGGGVTRGKDPYWIKLKNSIDSRYGKAYWIPSTKTLERLLCE